MADLSGSFFFRAHAVRMRFLAALGGGLLSSRGPCFGLIGTAGPRLWSRLFDGGPSRADTEIFLSETLGQCRDGRESADLSPWNSSDVKGDRGTLTSGVVARVPLSPPTGCCSAWDQVGAGPVSPAASEVKSVGEVRSLEGSGV